MINPLSDFVLVGCAAAKTLPMGDSKGNSATLLLRGKAKETFDNGATFPPAHGAAITDTGAKRPVNPLRLLLFWQQFALIIHKTSTIGERKGLLYG
ncbi:hypothetical protein [Shewanella dokdonensis]|uniref:Uncharacterized protein n=1 Tax=Shewanella dokdonensis TaxID=712036 RepID=A0ABX8DEI4_9GAMM|nr:hypothetical protein [Shewanella dokdonensis]MCL1073376.1 hypothetical protein [Shewanella dokdonensis]QVK22805.1 hypothetical protein KHX94_16580 [Shewanella dokdonensis]